MRAFVVVAIAAARVAHADPDADALTAQGEQLAKDGEYSRAIEAFKQADARAPSAKHACLIGLAYTRRELWSQAEIFLDRCKARAKADDPLPDWFSAAEAQLAQKLRGVDVASVDIRVTPDTTPALISVSSFPPDETFAPRTIHLVPGSYLITATVPGRPPVSENVNVKLGTGNVVTLSFTEPAAPPPPRRPAHVTRSALPTYLLIGAGAVAVVGIGFHLYASSERGALQDAIAANDPTAYADHQGTFETARGVAIGCYGAAAIAAGIGIVLRMHDERAPVITGAVAPGGAVVGIEVRR